MTISKIAFEGLMEDNLVFNEEHFRSCPEARETTLRVGVLTEEKRIISRDRRHDLTQKRLESTISFPHKLFQEFLAGKHLASLFLSKHTAEYSSLLDQKVLPKRGEFKHLLYFTASQNTEVGKDIVTRMSNSCSKHGEITHLQSPGQPEEKKDQPLIDVIVDVAFECNDKVVGCVVKERVLRTPIKKFAVTKEKSAHTLAGYLFLISELVSDISLQTLVYRSKTIVSIVWRYI